eukprot:126986-Chlamydomonas_euryale.AAC.16
MAPPCRSAGADVGCVMSGAVAAQSRRGGVAAPSCGKDAAGRRQALAEKASSFFEGSASARTAERVPTQPPFPTRPCNALSTLASAKACSSACHSPAADKPTPSNRYSSIPLRLSHLCQSEDVVQHSLLQHELAVAAAMQADAWPLPVPME